MDMIDEVRHNPDKTNDGIRRTADDASLDAGGSRRLQMFKPTVITRGTTRTNGQANEGCRRAIDILSLHPYLCTVLHQTKALHQHTEESA
jgi:hypothetical protein